jgi:hypothetical protein
MTLWAKGISAHRTLGTIFSSAVLKHAPVSTSSPLNRIWMKIIYFSSIDKNAAFVHACMHACSSWICKIGVWLKGDLFLKAVIMNFFFKVNYLATTSEAVSKLGYKFSNCKLWTYLYYITTSNSELPDFIFWHFCITCAYWLRFSNFMCDIFAWFLFTLIFRRMCIY